MEFNVMKMETGVLTSHCSKDDVLFTQPDEEILGSVTTYNPLDSSDQNSGGKNCQQLRSSARVIKKLKLDSTNLSANVVNHLEKKEENQIGKESDRIEPKAKIIRPKVVWSHEDKTHFFDAIKEYGKDFDAVHDYIASKYKKKGVQDSQIKTKEQVRHFYYRSWQKVSKFLIFSDEVKKVVQEFYALINYGELRRKVGVMSEKTCMKLNELMYRGATQIRAKGKTVRIKTPMCRTLRKLNQIDERPEDFKLPTKVLVELRPRDMETFTYVQGMGQNPRVICNIPLQKRLQVLISCLNSRWKTNDQRAYEKVLNCQTCNNTPSSTSEEEVKPPLEPVLKVAPKSGASIQLPNIHYSEFLTSCRISLSAYEERMGIKNRGELLWLASLNNPKGAASRLMAAKKGTKRIRNDSTGDKVNFGKNVPNVSGLSDSLAEVKNEPCENTPEEQRGEVSDVVDSVINTILALSQQTNCDTSKTSTTGTDDGAATSSTSSSVPTKIESDNKKLSQRQLAVDTVRNGWSAHNIDSITVGELYLMIGADSKLELEYWWETESKVFDEKKDIVKTNENCLENSNINNNKLNNTSVALRKLLSLAKLHYRKDRVECPCGHICGGSSSNRANSSNRNKTTMPVLRNIQRVEIKTPLENTGTMEELSISAKNIINQRVDGVFRVPTDIARHSSALEAFKAQLDSLKPRCQRRGRNFRSKQVVVQRTLPLLPKSVGNNEHSLVTMKVIPQGSLTSDFVPITSTVHPLNITTATPTTKTESISATNLKDEASLIEANQTNNENNEVNSEIVSFMDLELNGKTNPTSLSLEETNSEVASFAGLLSSTSNDNLNDQTPSVSPSRLLKDDDNQWLNSEVADFSLSSFLGHLESPLKTEITQSVPSIVGEDTRMSQDVEAQLQSLMSESSIDYMAKFADLAAQMSCDNMRK